MMLQVPNWGQDPDKTFDIRLTDAVGEHEVYLTRLVFEPTLYSTASASAAARNSLQAVNDDPSTGSAVLLAVLVVAGSLAVVLLLTLAVAYVYRSTMSRRLPLKVEDSVGSRRLPLNAAEKDTVVYDVNRGEVVTSAGGGTAGRGCGERTFIIALYFTFWGVYSVAVTFTAVSALLAALTAGTTEQLHGAAATIRAATDTVGGSATAAVDRYAAAESRRLQTAVADVQRACSDHYVDELFAGVAFQIDRAILSDSRELYVDELFAGVAFQIDRAILFDPRDLYVDELFAGVTFHIDRAILFDPRDPYVDELFAGVAFQIDRVILSDTRDLYVDELFAGVAFQIDRAILSNSRPSLSRVVRDRTARLVDAFRRQVDNYAAAYRSNVTTAMTGKKAKYTRGSANAERPARRAIAEGVGHFDRPV